MAVVTPILHGINRLFRRPCLRPRVTYHALVVYCLTPLIASSGLGSWASHGLASEDGGEIVYDGEPGSVPSASPVCLEYATETTAVAHNGSRSLHLHADPWHRPALKLYCGGQPRRNLGAADFIEFFMRASDADNAPMQPTFHVTTWHTTSPSVPILEHIDGGILDETWRRVRIPISLLKTEAWSLSDVEFLKWGTDPTSRTAFVDDIVLRTVSAIVLEEVIVDNHRHVRLRFSDPVTRASARQPAQYSVWSDDDPAYADAQQPIAVGYEQRVVDFAGANPVGDEQAPVVQTDITLRLPAPLQPNVRYTLGVRGMTDATGTTMADTTVPVTFDAHAPSPHVKINQVGYTPEGPKWGYVGGYVGDLGGGIWAVGEMGSIVHWAPDTGWNAVPLALRSPMPHLRAVHPLTEDDIWAVGDAGMVVYWDGTAWSEVAVPTSADLYDVVFTPQAEGWIVGSSGTILHRVPGTTTWDLVTSPTTATLRGVFALHDATAWAVGDAGVLLTWDGNSWSTLDRLTTATLHAVGGMPGARVWAVGEAGTMLALRWNTWNVLESITTATLRDVVGAANGDVLAVGDGGVILRQAGFSNTPFVLEASPGTETLHAVAFLDARQGFAVGQSGTVYRYDGDTDRWVTDTVTLPTTTPVTLLGATALPYGSLRLTAHHSVPDPAPTTVDIVDVTTGVTHLSVPLELRAANWHLAGEDVFAFDFSTLTTPGTYQARVPGFGVSASFVIAPDVYREAAHTVARGLYHQRCGTALTMTDHPHGVCHIEAAVYHGSIGTSLLYTNEPVGAAKDVSGGWHDAGDYNKYVPTGATALWYLLTSFELSGLLPGASQSARFGDDWGIPESGNSVPDVLDEARWELDWIVRLQEADGGMPHKVTTACWFAGMPDESSETQYILAKTTHDTALAAAVLALGSRLWQPYDADRAAIYLDRAQRAWSFLEAHPDPEPDTGFANPEGICTGEYPDPYGDTDKRAWAAAELYRTTGAPEYHTAFAIHWAKHAPLWGWNDWQQQQRKASWAYVNTAWPEVNTTWKQQIADSIIVEATTLRNTTQTAPYHNGARLDVPAWIGWGTFTHSTIYAFGLLQAYALTNDGQYWDAALLNLNTQLGANPLNLSFITGVGTRTPQDPLHKPSMYDGIEAPVPGIPVFGPMARLHNNNPYHVVIQDDTHAFPQAHTEYDPYPILRRYVDTNEIVPYSEFTIVEMARTAGVLGLVSCVSETATCQHP